MAKTRVALVTGGTRGIGEAIARRLDTDGFAVFISGSTEESTRGALARFAKDGAAIRGFAGRGWGQSRNSDFAALSLRMILSSLADWFVRVRGQLASAKLRRVI